jgi:hypothetical protein
MNRTHRLSELAIVLRGRTPANTVSEPAGPPFFGMEEIAARAGEATRYLSPEVDLDRAVFLEKGDVVVALLDKIGASAVINAQTAGSVLGRECVALRITSSELGPAWFSEWTGSDEFKSQAAQHTSGTTMPRLPLKALWGFKMTLPSLEEQRALEKLANRFDAAIATTAKTLDDLQDLRAAEMQLVLAKTQPADTP